MRQNEVVRFITVILETLVETTKPGQSLPLSMVYLALNSNIELQRIVTNMLVHQGWAVVTAETITATAAGRELVNSCK